uniref:Uncharacterized protein n=1 Tax=Arundo donax TaxID=35708 RepID=A0A0A9BV29_ARUDO
MVAAAFGYALKLADGSGGKARDGVHEGVVGEAGHRARLERFRAAGRGSKLRCGGTGDLRR